MAVSYEMQTEGGQDTPNVVDNLVPAPSAPFNPASGAQNAAIEPHSSIQSNAKSMDDRKHPLRGWWWKLLIVLFVLFAMVLFIVWIGPTYVWADTVSGASNSTQTKETTHAPTLHPILVPTVQPTVRPTVGNPTQSPFTLQPTIQPTFCPTREDTYFDDELCTIVAVTKESCTEVDMGYQYGHEMAPVECTQSVSCIYYSKCFNQTHVADSDGISESDYTPYSVGQTATCVVTRSCDDGQCQACDKSGRYNCMMNVFGKNQLCDESASVVFAILDLTHVSLAKMKM
eukprot:347744_1